MRKIPKKIMNEEREHKKSTKLEILRRALIEIHQRRIYENKAMALNSSSHNPQSFQHSFLSKCITLNKKGCQTILKIFLTKPSFPTR
jgi:hypothetical protein